MPKMSGIETTKTLRRMKFPGIIIGVTGNSAHEDIQDFLDAGAEDVLIKPITFAQLEACVEQAVRKHSTIQRSSSKRLPSSSMEGKKLFLR